MEKENQSPKQSTEQPSENEKQELKAQLQKHVDKTGIKFNPNEKIVNGILTGLLKNKEKHGDNYCPCRLVTKNKEKDKEIACPCVFHRGEIELQGHCHCNIFVK
jgi:ferredoxin-thioredoxin reductase catalytic subunit